MLGRFAALAVGISLSACAGQTPDREIKVCLEEKADLEKLKLLAFDAAITHELQFQDHSETIRTDLKEVGSQLETDDLLSIFIEDSSWRSKAGATMIHNVGTSAPEIVTVSMFHNDDLFGTDENTKGFRSALLSAISDHWEVFDVSDVGSPEARCSRQ